MTDFLLFNLHRVSFGSHGSMDETLIIDDDSVSPAEARFYKQILMKNSRSYPSIDVVSNKRFDNCIDFLNHLWSNIFSVLQVGQERRKVWNFVWMLSMAIFDGNTSLILSSWSWSWSILYHYYLDSTIKYNTISVNYFSLCVGM